MKERILFHWVVVHNQIGYSTVQTVVIIYDNNVIEPYNNTIGAYGVEHKNVMILDYDVTVIRLARGGRYIFVLQEVHSP